MSTCGEHGGRRKDGSACVMPAGWGIHPRAAEPGRCKHHADPPDDQGRDARQAAFLAAYAEMGTVGHAAAAAGIHRRSHYLWMDEDPDYPARFDDAKEEVREKLEREAIRRAAEGLRQYKFTKDGKPLLHPATGEPYYEHVFSDSLLQFVLKSIAPEKYRDQKLELSGPNGGPIQTRAENSLDDLSDAELAQLAAKLADEHAKR